MIDDSAVGLGRYLKGLLAIQVRLLTKASPDEKPEIILSSPVFRRRRLRKLSERVRRGRQINPAREQTEQVRKNAKPAPATIEDLLNQAKTTNRLLAAQLRSQMPPISNTESVIWLSAASDSTVGSWSLTTVLDVAPPTASLSK